MTENDIGNTHKQNPYVLWGPSVHPYNLQTRSWVLDNAPCAVCINSSVDLSSDDLHMYRRMKTVSNLLLNYLADKEKYSLPGG